MTTMTRSSANLRGAILVSAAVLTTALADKTLQHVLPPVVLSVLASLTSGLVSWRLWLDNSNAQANAATATVPPSGTFGVTDAPASPAAAGSPVPAAPPVPVESVPYAAKQQEADNSITPPAVTAATIRASVPEADATIPNPTPTPAKPA